MTIIPKYLTVGMLLALWCLSVGPGCGQSGNDDDPTPEPATDQPVLIHTGTSDADGNVTLDIAGEAVTFEVNDQETGEGVENVEIHVGEDGENAVLLAVDPLGRYGHVLKDARTDTAPGTPRSTALTGAYWDVFVTVAFKEISSGLRPARIEYPDPDTCRELLDADLRATVTVGEMDQALETSFLEWGSNTVIQLTLATIGAPLVGALGNVASALSIVGTRDAWTLAQEKEKAAEKFRQACYGEDALVDVYILGEGEIVLIPRNPPTGPATTQPGTLRGKVLDAAEHRLFGSLVKIRVQNRFQEVVSDVDGNYVIENVGGGCVAPEDIVFIATAAGDGTTRTFTGAHAGLIAGTESIFDFCLDGPCLVTVLYDDFEDNDITDWSLEAPSGEHSDSRDAREKTYPNVSGGVVFGIGSGYGVYGLHATMSRAIVFDATHGMKISMRALAEAGFPNSMSVKIASADGWRTPQWNGYIFNVYGEGAKRFEITRVTNGTMEHLGQYPLGTSVHAWHTYEVTRDRDGQWSLRIDGVEQTAASFTADTTHMHFDHAALFFHRDGSKCDWVRLERQGG